MSKRSETLPKRTRAPEIYGSLSRRFGNSGYGLFACQAQPEDCGQGHGGVPEIRRGDRLPVPCPAWEGLRSTALLIDRKAARVLQFDRAGAV